MGDHVFLKVMPKRGVVRFGKRGKLAFEVYWALRGTREGEHSCILVSATTEFIRCP